jgi:hypothetical protein
MLLPQEYQHITDMSLHGRYEAARRGRKRELLFLHSWRSVLHEHLWLRSVREANKKEDQKEHTDAFLLLSTGQEIGIQIKGTTESARLFAKKWDPDSLGIAVVVVGDDYSANEVVFSTFTSLEMAWRHIGLDGAQVHQFKVWRYLEAWKGQADLPSWFKSAREATPQERERHGFDVMIERIDGHELPVHVHHNVKSVQRIAFDERKDGIPRLAVLVLGSSTKAEIRDMTVSALDSMNMRIDKGLLAPTKRKNS